MFGRRADTSLFPLLVLSKCWNDSPSAPQLQEAKTMETPLFPYLGREIPQPLCLRCRSWGHGCDSAAMNFAAQGLQKVKPMTVQQSIAIGKPHTSLSDLLAARIQHRRTKAEQRYSTMGSQSWRVWMFQPEHEVHLRVIATVSCFWDLI